MKELEVALRTTILSRCLPVLCIVFLCILLWFSSYIQEKHDAHYDKKKLVPIGKKWDKSCQAEIAFHKKSRQQKRNGIYLAAVILVIVFLFRLFPACGDLLQERYVMIEGEALFGQIGTGNSVTVQTDTGTLKLDLPVNWKDLDLPIQDQYGKIWYSQNSRILLGFGASGEGAK